MGRVFVGFRVIRQSPKQNETKQNKTKEQRQNAKENQVIGRIYFQPNHIDIVLLSWPVIYLFRKEPIKTPARYLSPSTVITTLIVTAVTTHPLPH